jgi:hypothetical protein
LKYPSIIIFEVFRSVPLMLLLDDLGQKESLQWEINLLQRSFGERQLRIASMSELRKKSETRKQKQKLEKTVCCH